MINIHKYQALCTNNELEPFADRKKIKLGVMSDIKRLTPITELREKYPKDIDPEMFMNFIRWGFDPGEHFQVRYGLKMVYWCDYDGINATLQGAKKSEDTQDRVRYGQKHNIHPFLRQGYADSADIMVNGFINPDHADKPVGKRSRVLVVECDDSSLDEQLQNIQKFQAQTGLTGMAVDSGKKSIHYYLFCSDLLNETQVVYLRGLLACYFKGDVKMTVTSQISRMPGAIRPGGVLQAKLWEPERRYSYSEIKQGFKVVFDSKGFYLPTEQEFLHWWNAPSTPRTTPGLKPLLDKKMYERIFSLLTAGYPAWCEYVQQEQQKVEAKREAERQRWGQVSNGTSLSGYTLSLMIGASRKSNDLLNEGAPEGGRNNAGTALWADLKGVQQEYYRLGITPEDTPEALLEEYGQLVGLPSREIQQIMRWNRGTLSPSGDVERNVRYYIMKTEKRFDEKPKNKVIIQGETALEKIKADYVESRFNQFRNELFSLTAKIATKTGFKKKVELVPQRVVYVENEGQVREVIQNNKYVYDNRPVGSGKSRLAGKMEGVFLHHKDALNPTTEELENNYIPFPARSAHGMFMVNGRLVNDPPPEHRIEASLIEPANCPFNIVAPYLFEKNYNEVFSKKGEGICSHCPMFVDCQKNGYRAKKKEVFASAKRGASVRMHPKQLTPINETINDPGGAFHKRRIYFDEIGEAAKTETIIANKESCLSNSLKVITLLLDCEDIPSEINIGVTKAVSKIVKLMESQEEFDKRKDKIYGIDEVTLSEYLGDAPENLSKYISDIAIKLHSDLRLFVDKFETDKDELNNAYTREAEAMGIAKQMIERLDELPSNWVISFLQVWSGEIRGTIHIDNEQNVCISWQDTTIKDIANSNHGGFVAMDATARLEEIVAITGVPAEEWIVVRQKVQMPNLNIHVCDIPGLKSNSWSLDAQYRSKLLLQSIKNVAGCKTKIITLKKNKHLIDANYHFGLHTRGTNIMKNDESIIIVGTPYMNLGDVKREYYILYGSYDEFSDYYDHLYQQELIQACGRLRAQWSNKPKHIYVIGTELNYDFMKDEFGCHVAYENISELCPDALKGIDKAWHFMKEAAKGIIKAGEKITQLAVAEKTGYCQSYVSRVARTFIGTWGEFKKLVHSLINIVKKDLVISKTQDDGLAMYLQYASEEDILDMLRVYTKKGLKGLADEILEYGASTESVTELIWLFVPFFEPKIQEMSREIFALFDTC